ncbi:ParA family protein [Hyphomonas sp. NPDC076900]
MSLGFAAGRYSNGGEIRKLKAELDKRKVISQTETAALKDAFEQGADFWLKRDVKKFPDFDLRRENFAIPTVVVSNLKGGVGKTTITANLAAYFAAKGKRVLILDLDWQGSLANVFNTLRDADSALSEINQVFSPDADGSTLLSLIRWGGRIPDDLCYVTTYKSFSDTENQILVQWIRGDLPFDAHFLLANVLWTQAVKGRFDVVLIDTPPRMTAGLVNALSCASHLIVPTVLDETSGEAAAAFIQTADKFAQRYNPQLRIAGIVGSLTTRRPSLTASEERSRTDLVSRVDRLKLRYTGDELVANVWIPKKAAFADVAGRSIAYSSNSEVKLLFDQLAIELKMDKI